MAYAFGVWFQGLISKLCQKGGLFAGKYGCLVTFFDIIQYFSIVALFGWFTFANLTEDELKRVPKTKKKLAKRNRVIINQLFIGSFLFFAISAIADYIFHHSTISTGLAMMYNPEAVLSILVVTFLTGIGLSVAPIAYVFGLNGLGKHLGSFELPPFRRVFLYLLMATASSLLLWTAITTSTVLFYLSVVFGFVPYVGLFLTLWYWKIKLRRRGFTASNGFILGMILIFSPVILIVLIALMSWGGVRFG